MAFLQDERTRIECLLEGFAFEDNPASGAEPRLENLSRVRRVFQYAGLSAQDFISCARIGSVLLLFVLIGSFLFRTCYFVLGAAALLGLLRIRLEGMILRRARSFESDYPVMLLSLASTIRTGIDPLIAIVALQRLFPEDSVIRKELVELKINLDSGVPEEIAVRRFGSSIRHPDTRLFIVAFILSRRAGSSLADCLQRLAKVTRQRQSFRRKTRAAVAMQKLSALGIAGSAVAIGIVQMLSNPQALRLSVSHPIGSKLLGAGVALLLVGTVWMMRLASPRV